MPRRGHLHSFMPVSMDDPRAGQRGLAFSNVTCWLLVWTSVASLAPLIPLLGAFSAVSPSGLVPMLPLVARTVLLALAAYGFGTGWVLGPALLGLEGLLSVWMGMSSWVPLLPGWISKLLPGVFFPAHVTAVLNLLFLALAGRALSEILLHSKAEEHRRDTVLGRLSLGLALGAVVAHLASTDAAKATVADVSEIPGIGKALASTLPGLPAEGSIFSSREHDRMRGRFVSILSFKTSTNSFAQFAEGLGLKQAPEDKGHRALRVGKMLAFTLGEVPTELAPGDPVYSGRVGASKQQVVIAGYNSAAGKAVVSVVQLGPARGK